MSAKMPCHISDGPQTPEDVPSFQDPDPDEAYDREVQRQLDDDMARDQARGAVCTVCHENWVDAAGGEDTCPDCMRAFQ